MSNPPLPTPAEPTLASEIASPTAASHSWPKRLLQLVVDHNPFFLLSGVCMLAGCYIINGAIHEEPDRLGVLLGLLGVFNLYEMLVIALGFFLLRYRDNVRHAGWLLLLEVFLLVDATLLYNEVATASLGIGAIVATGAVLWSIVKLAVLFRLVGLRLHVGDWAILTLNLMVLFSLPVLLRGLADAERLTPAVMAQMWVAGGLLLALQACPARWWASDVGYRDLPGLRHAVGVAAAVLSVVSVLGHLRASMYVYDMPVFWSHYAPLLLGSAVVLIRQRSGRTTHAILRGSVTAMVALAILLSLDQRTSMMLMLGSVDPMILSPLRVTLLGSACVFAILWWSCGSWWLAAAVPMLIGTGWLGHQPSVMRANLREMWNALARMQESIRPQSAFSWGILTVVLAFVFLALGAILSMLVRPQKSLDRL